MSKKVNLRLDWCSYEAAKYAVEHWHYSKSMPTPPVLRLGVWENNQFIGCVLFSRGANNDLGSPYGLEMTQCCELTRIALTVHQTPVSKLIRIAISELKKKEKGLRLIVSYADPNHNHIGAIYQATNWVYTGTTPNDCKYKDKFGRIWHSRQVKNSGVTRQYGELRYGPKRGECERIKQLGKYRYLYPLDEVMRKQIEPLRKPYPKRGTGEIDSAAQSNEQTGGASPTVPL